MAEVQTSSWSETAASNNSAAPDGWPEGMSYASVNDAAREMMAALKREWNRSHYTVTTGGSATAYTLTFTTAPPAYVTGMTLTFKLHAANSSGAATLNVNGLGAKNLRLMDGSVALPPYVLPLSGLVTVVYDGTQFVVLTIADYTPTWKLIARQTISGATASFLSGALPTQFTEFEIAYENAVPQTGPTSLYLRYSIDNGVSYKSGASDYGFHYLSVVGAVTTAAATGASNTLDISDTQSQSVGATRGAIQFSRVSGHCHFWSEGFDATPALATLLGSGNATFTGPITNALVAFVTDNILTGTFTLSGRV